MPRLLLRRFVHGLFLLFGVSLMSFAMAELAPGDYFDEMRLDPRISADTVEAMRQRFGLDRPFAERYLRWLASVARGDLGFSFSYNSPVAPLLRVRALNTLLLTGTATLLTWVIAVPLGVLTAAHRGRWAKSAFAVATSVLLAVPDLVLALGFLFLAARTGALPVGGMVGLDFATLSPWGQVKDLLSHLVLPVSAMTLATLPVVARHVHSSVSEILDSTFLLAARGLGIPRWRLLFRYALPVAANPLISLLGFSIGSLLSASLLIEVIFGWPGLGPLLLEAILARDVYLVIGAVMLSTVFLILGNLLADLLLHAVDPRIREE